MTTPDRADRPGVLGAVVPPPPVLRGRGWRAERRCGCPVPGPGPAGSAGPRWRWTRPRCNRLVEDSIAADGLVATWDEVARPVLAAVGDRWATTGRGVEVEHLLSQCLVAVFGTRTAPRHRGPRACPDAPGPARRDADRTARRPARRARGAAGGAGGRLPLARGRPARRRPRRRRAPYRARRRRALVPARRRRPTRPSSPGCRSPGRATGPSSPAPAGTAPRCRRGWACSRSLVDAGERIGAAVLR